MKPIMRTLSRAAITLLFAVLALGVFAPSVLMQQSGGPYILNPTVIAGGGGTSSNGSTRIDGTVGQGILGSSTGGNFTLNAGFWQSAQAPAGTFSVSGKVTYVVPTCTSPSGVPVPNVVVSAVGTPPGGGNTDSGGNYTISNLTLMQPYTITPSKTALLPGPATPQIDTTDVLLARRQFLGGFTPLTSCQLIAAEVTGDAVIDTSDVLAIRRFFLNTAGFVNTGKWNFTPANYFYLNPVGDMTAQNFAAVALGDINGDLTPTQPSVQVPTAPASVAQVSLPVASVANTASTQTLFILPVTTTTILAGDNLVGFQGRLDFDSTVVTFAAAPVAAAGLTGDPINTWTVSGSVTGAGPIKTLTISANVDDTVTPLSGSGVLFNLRLRVPVAATVGSMTALTWEAGANGFTFIDTGLVKQPPGSTPAGNITIGGAPSAVRLERCIATGYDNGVHLEWKTGLEVDNLGFNVYREKAGQKELITPEMVAGSALLTGKAKLQTGRTYAWWDSSKDQRGVQYWLEDIDLNGQSNWHGPISSQFVGGSPPSQSDAAVLSGIGNSKASPNTGAIVERRALARASADQPAIQFDLAGGPAAKVSVRHEGWYTLSLSQLVAGGLTPNTNPDRLQMYVDGLQVPINVITDDRKQLSAVEFYGVGLDAAYTDARVYWIVEGKENGLRIQQVKADAHPSNDRSFNYSVERRDRTVYFSSLRNGERENFFGPVVGRDAVTQSLALQRIDTSATTQAQVEVSLQGVTAIPHRVWVYANETFAGEIPFNGQELKVASFALPVSLLKEGDNEVRLVAQGGSLDVSLIDYIRVSYPHTFSAEADRLRFTATAGAAVTVDGFSNAAIRVFDITNQDQVKQLVGKVEQQTSGYSVTVAPVEKGDRTLLAIAGQMAGTPPGVSANVASNLRSNSHAANLVIVTNRDFFPALETLKRLRTSQGYKVEIVDVEDIFDEFSFGDKSPYAVRAFLQYARANWKTPPQYLLLAADASYDPKNYLGFGDWDIVPTKLIDTEFMETFSDDWFADFDADGVPEMAVGRLPVRSKEEAASMVARIVGYDQSAGVAELTLVADANEGFDFESATAQLRALVPSGTRVVEIDRGQMGDQAKPALLDAINRGQKIVNYTGHGNVDLWRANLLTNADAGLLTNQNHLALFVMMTCLNGYSDDPALSSLAKALMKSASGGAVAVWASSGTTMPDEQVLMNQEFYRQLFANRGITLGDAIKRAKAAVGDADVRRTWNFLGDPTMRLK